MSAERALWKWSGKVENRTHGVCGKNALIQHCLDLAVVN